MNAESLPLTRFLQFVRLRGGDFLNDGLSRFLELV